MGFCLLTLSIACGSAQSSHSTAEDCRGRTILHDDDAIRFRECTVVHGDLELGGALQSTAAFKAIQVVHGDLKIGPSYQLSTVIGLAAVRQIDGNVTISSNLALGGVFLSSVETVGGDIIIQQNRSLRSAVMQNLIHVRGSMTVTGNLQLIGLDISKLKNLGGKITVSGPQIEIVSTTEELNYKFVPEK